jgi:hypothetical protein
MKRRTAAAMLLCSLAAGCATQTSQVVKDCGLEPHEGWRELTQAPEGSDVILQDLRSDTPFKPPSTPVETHAHWLRTRSGQRLAYCEELGSRSKACGASSRVSAVFNRRGTGWMQEGYSNLIVCSR